MGRDGGIEKWEGDARGERVEGGGAWEKGREAREARNGREGRGEKG